MIQKWLNDFFSSIFAPESVSGACWNAVIGLLVLCFTVYFVDRKAKKRENERWLPAKYNVYYNLFWSLRTIDHLLGLSHKWREDEYYYYYFGAYFIATHYDVKNLKYQEVEFSGISIQGLNEYTVSELGNILNEIKDLMNNYPQLLEPELLSQLLLLKERLPPIIANLTHYLPTEPDDRKGSIDMRPLAEEVFSLLVWLSTKSRISKQPDKKKNLI